MADFCHDWDPEGLGCGGGPCPEICIGDFTGLIEEHTKDLWPGFMVGAGLCEGHGSAVYFERHKDGSLWFKHGKGHDYIKDEPIEVPEPVRIDGNSV